MKKYTHGFTLIELLVVIAIIGILSSVVLASLNRARTRAGDAAIQSDIAGIRSQAEIIYNDDGNYLNVCADTIKIQPALAGAQTAGSLINSNNYDSTVAGSAGTVTCHSTTAGWAAEAPLKSDPAVFWCADSISSSAGQQAGGSTLAADDVTCGV